MERGLTPKPTLWTERRSQLRHFFYGTYAKSDFLLSFFQKTANVAPALRRKAPALLNSYTTVYFGNYMVFFGLNFYWHA